jgi:hypothetical protein
MRMGVMQSEGTASGEERSEGFGGKLQFVNQQSHFSADAETVRI